MYHSIFAYFNRDNVGLPGLAAHFKAESVEERHTRSCGCKFQGTRGGKVKLGAIINDARDGV